MSLDDTTSQRLPWGVAALLLATQDALAARFGAVAVRGELSGFTRAASGHCYFSLKDAEGASALLRCAMFRRAATLLDFQPVDGQQVQLRGRLGVFEPRGELQLVVESLQRLGAGSLYEEFLRRRARLEAQGLFDATRKRPLPRHPQVLGVVSSLAAAALRDMLTTLARRAPQVRVIVYPSAVQGAEAPEALAEALRTAGRRGEVEALLLVRGGGSLEDLWAFNDEAVVRAVAASRLPVVCGVGHETDTTLAELAADLRAPTPTAAAELATPVCEDELASLALQAGRLQRAVRRRLDNHAQRLDRLALHMGRPARVLDREGARLQRQAARLDHALHAGLQRQQQALPQLARRLVQAATWQHARLADRLARAALKLEAHDPHQVLSRGYAWLADGQGRPVTRAAGLVAGDLLQAQWADGRAAVAVQSVDFGRPVPADGRAAAAGGDPPPSAPSPVAAAPSPARASRRRRTPPAG